MRAAEAMLAGGISIFEITMTVPDAPVGDPVARARGSAIAPSSAPAPCSTPRPPTRCIDAGAAFIVSPGLDLATIAAAHARGVPVDARRAHADRGDHRLEGGRRHGEDLPRLGGGRPQVPARAARPAAPTSSCSPPAA